MIFARQSADIAYNRTKESRMTVAEQKALATESVSERFEFHDVGWDFYERVLHAVRDRRVFVTYDRGELEIMSPSKPHEQYKKVLARMIEAATEEMGLPIGSTGSMTMRRQDLDRGLEPDECYYVQNESAARQVKEADLSNEPPPDLVVEMDYSYRRLDREGIYAALGVPEVWRFDLVKLEFLKLAGGRYQPVDVSVVLPGLPRADVERLLKMRATHGENDVVRAWRQWLKAWMARR
jgi:Uma2 family endonuclease